MRRYLRTDKIKWIRLTIIVFGLLTPHKLFSVSLESNNEFSVFLLFVVSKVKRVLNIL